MRVKISLSLLAFCLMLIKLHAQTWPPERKDVLHYVGTPFNYNFELGLCPCLQGDPFNQSNCFSQGLNAEWEYLIRIDSDNFELNFPAGMNQDTISRSPSVFGSF
jgi:hypothetical protein